MNHPSALLVDHPGFLAYDFGPYHPLRPERITLALDLLRQSRLLSAHQVLEPQAADADELGLIHQPDFLQAVQAASQGQISGHESGRYGLASRDNPPFAGMHEAASLLAGGAAAGMRSVLSGRTSHVFHPAGGLHHASARRASGFCVYNDPALAAAVAAREFGARVLYVDFDAHHGDGTQDIFYQRSDVLTISYHESGRFLFPGTGNIGERGRGEGLGHSVNLPAAPFTQDDSWLEGIEATLPALVARFRPDVLISVHGSDTHLWDPLTHLALTTRSFERQAQLMHELAHQWTEGRWLAFGSGGYDWQRVVPRAWAILWAEMTGQPLPEKMPARWLDTHGGSEDLPETFLDAPSLGAASLHGREAAQSNRRTLERLRAVLDIPAAAPAKPAG